MTATQSRANLEDPEMRDVEYFKVQKFVSRCITIAFVLVAVVLIVDATSSVQPAYNGAVEGTKGEERFRIENIYFANFVSLLTFAMACVGAAVLRDLHAKIVMFTIFLGVLAAFLLIIIYAIVAGWEMALTVGFVQNQIFPLLGVGFLSTVIASHIMYSLSRVK